MNVGTDKTSGIQATVRTAQELQLRDQAFLD